MIDGMGGWVTLCLTAADQLPFRAREFERSYSAFRLRREVPEYPSHLIGRAEAENRMRGHAVAPPVLIGNPERAALVMERGAVDPVLRITKAADVAGAAIKRIGDAA